MPIFVASSSSPAASVLHDEQGGGGGDQGPSAAAAADDQPPPLPPSILHTARPLPDSAAEAADVAAANDAEDAEQDGIPPFCFVTVNPLFYFPIDSLANWKLFLSLMSSL